MKKILALMLVFVLSFSMIACSKTTKINESEDVKASDEEVQASDEVVEVDIFQFKIEIVEALEKAIALYEEKNPNVKINLQTVGGGDDYGAALRAQFQSGNEPDIFNVGGPQDVSDWMTKLEDLSDAPWSDKVLDGVLSGVTVEDKQYGLPYAIEGYGLVYNKEIFKEAGVDASKINSFDKLNEALEIIQNKIDNGELKEKFPLLEAPVSYAVKETWVTGLHSSNIAFSNEFSSPIETFDADSIEFKYADGFKAYLDLMADYSIYKDDKTKLNAVDYATQVDEGIAIERVAVVQQGNWIYGGVKDIDSEVADKLGFLPIPLKGVKEDSIAVGVPMYWTVNKESNLADKKAAKDFLNWLYTSEEGKKIVVNEMFFIPPLKGYDNVQPDNPLSKDILTYANDGKSMPWVFMGYPSDWGMGIMGQNIQKYYAGKISWDDLVVEVQKQWKEMR